MRVGMDYVQWEGILGRYGQGNISDNGKRLLSVCVEQGLAVANTWFAHKDIHRMTWRHPDHSAMKDFVLVRQD